MYYATVGQRTFRNVLVEIQSFIEFTGLAKSKNKSVLISFNKDFFNTFPNNCVAISRHGNISNMKQKRFECGLELHNISFQH